jgi:DNA polymerase III sliding clamp (beta) subunit (PCNA family)
VLPKEFWRKVDLKAEDLAAIIKRVSVCADERSCCIRFSVEGGSLMVEAEDSDKSAKGYVGITWPDDAPWKMGINWQYAMDFLKLTSGTVHFNIAEHNIKAGATTKAAEFVAEDGWVYLVMPMRIRTSPTLDETNKEPHNTI